MDDPVRRVVFVDGGYDDYDQEHALLAEVGAVFEHRPCAGSVAAVRQAVVDADVVMVREGPVDASVIGAMTRARAIVRYGIGVDNIDLEAARARRIQVANVPDYGTEEVSTHAVALALAAMRRIPMLDRRVRDGQWGMGVSARMHRWRGMTLGLVGYGRIARLTQAKLAGFGFARVLVHDPLASLPDDVQAVALDELCAQADLISLHAPLNSATRGMIDARRLALMKPTAVLVNTARGGLVATDALADALAGGRLLAAGLDVLDPEPLPAGHPLLSLDNAVITNHIGWYSEQAMQDLQRLAVQEAVRVLRGQPPLHWLNRW